MTGAETAALMHTSHGVLISGFLLSNLRSVAK
jgi:hypothetical protein